MYVARDEERKGILRGGLDIIFWGNGPRPRPRILDETTVTILADGVLSLRMPNGRYGPTQNLGIDGENDNKETRKN